jgi:type IX secretion system PorP/SprF family membrane protein
MYKGEYKMHIKSANIYLKVLFVIALCVIGLFNSKLFAQTEPMYSQYMYNMLGVNPAYAGNREALSLNFFQRNQWVGIKGAPKTTSISMDQSIKDGKLGWGIQVYDDRLGVEAASGLNGMLSTRIQVSEKGILSGGLSFGMMNYRINLNDVNNRNNPNDPSFISIDNPSKWNPSLGMGIYYNTDRFYAGLATPSILKARLASYENMITSIQTSNAFHLFANAGYVFDINEDVKLKPSTMIKMVSGAPIETDINLNVWLKDLLGFGASYRTGDAFVGMVELQATSNLRFGYAYDMPFNPLKYFTKGSHELMLRYEIGNFKTKIKSTRYF